MEFVENVEVLFFMVMVVIYFFDVEIWKFYVLEDFWGTV